MACTRRPRSEILADIEKWKAKLIEAEETLDGINAVANEENRFDDNEGVQRVRKRKLSDQTDYIEYIEDKLLKLRGELCGRSSVVTHKNYRQISPTGWNRR